MPGGAISDLGVATITIIMTYMYGEKTYSYGGWDTPAPGASLLSMPMS